MNSILIDPSAPCRRDSDDSRKIPVISTTSHIVARAKRELGANG